MSLKLGIVRLIYWLKGLSENPVELFRTLGVEESDSILEIGCAIGYHTFALAQIAAKGKGKIYAVDIWEEGLAHLKDRLQPDQEVESILSSAYTVELPPSSLDKVVFFNTLHEVSNPDKALEKWTAFLKRGGEFLYQDPEILPEKIQSLSKERLHHMRTVRGVHIFIRK